MMRELQLYLAKLKEMQAEYAHAKLAKPTDRTEFGYGLACGEYQGLCRAEQLLEQVTEEAARDDESSE